MADLDWIPVEQDTPEPGEKIIAVNKVREWTTTWKPGLLLGTCPVTHFARYERPYEATEPDCVKDNPGGWQRKRVTDS